MEEDGTLEDQARAENRRKLDENLARVKKYSGVPPPEEDREEPEARNFQRDWEAWKRLFGHRIVDRAPKPVADPHADYKLLGIPPQATADEIRKAYYRLAKIHHPDQGGDESKFLVLMEAYRRLSGNA